MTGAGREISFVDLAAQQARIAVGLRRRIEAVLDRGTYIMGPEVRELEEALARFAGVRHCVSCSSGTDALLLTLIAWGIGPGDAVFVPSFTFVATAEAVALLGAAPVFVDVRERDFTMDSASLEAALARTADEGLRLAAVVPVDLFGQPADYPAIHAVARAAGLRVLADAAQSFGASLDGAAVGTLAEATAVSFFPAKPLGCYGDGGAVFTGDDDLAEALRSLRGHGQGAHKYEAVRIGINGRLDTLQAAVLLEKLAIFPDEVVARQRRAERYADGLRGLVGVPEVRPGATSVWAQYTVTAAGRARLAASLKTAGVPTVVYYPKPLHRQSAYARFPRAAENLPVSDALSGTVLSLPMHPYLEAEVQDRIVDAVRAAVRD